MASHLKKHGITSEDDHISGTPAQPGEFNALGTNEEGILSELVVEAVRPATLRAGMIVRRGPEGQIALPTQHAAGQEAISFNQAANMVGQGPYRGFIEGAHASHTSADIAGLKVSDKIINLTDNHIYMVTGGLENGDTGNVVEWDQGFLPDEEVYYFNVLTGTQIAYRPERGEWVEMGASTHYRSHDIEASADHFSKTNRTGILYTHDKNINILPMVDQEFGNPSVPVGSILVSSGNGTPEFSAIKVAPRFSTGSYLEPKAGDAAQWASGTFGFITTPTGVFLVLKVSGSVIKSVELT